MNILAAVDCLVFNSRDNVGVVISSEGKSGQSLVIHGSSKNTIRLRNYIPKNHKVAIKEIGLGKPVIKFGQVIGISTKRILPGEHVHLHNIRFSEKKHFFKDFSSKSPRFLLKKKKNLPTSFIGFLRKDGQAGVRNYVVVASTVNCSASVARKIADHFVKKSFSQKGIDGVIPLIHKSGCTQMPQDYQILKRTITGWLDHPNVVGATVVGLGCEGITIEDLTKEFGLKNTASGVFLDHLNIQDVGGTQRAVELGIEKVKRILVILPKFERKALPVSLLSVGLECGGSDAFSAVTANPALGIAGDILVSCGGTIVLSETPECWGAEESLYRRCVVGADKKKLKKIFSWWDNYGNENNVNMNNNLAKGNITGGITTILEKSLGATAKAGSSRINQVLDYAERMTKKGLVFMNTPGYDPVSVTGLVAGGCNLIAFTTGRGSVFGSSIAPTIKISSNSELYKKQKDDIDIDAGRALNKANLAEIGEEIYKLLIQVASGYKTRSEKHGVGREEFVPWQIGSNL